MISSSRFFVVVLVLTGLCAACGSSPPEREKVVPPTPAPAFDATPDPGPTIAPPTSDPVVSEEATANPMRDEPLGVVAGIPIRAEHLLEEWYQIAPREVWLVVDKLVAVRLALAEAERLGLTVEGNEVEERYAEERRLLAADVARERPGMTVEQFVAEELGQSPARYAAALRAAAADQMLIERAVRSWVLANESLALRLIVVPSGDMETIQDLLDGGADFAELARVHSIDDTAEIGGLVPYLVRQEDSPLTRAAFDTEVGAIGGPLRAGEHALLFRVEARRAARPEAWNDLRGAVLESLAEHSVTDTEFLHWKITMERQYPLDLRRLQELLGAAPPGGGG